MPTDGPEQRAEPVHEVIPGDLVAGGGELQLVRDVLLRSGHRSRRIRFGVPLSHAKPSDVPAAQLSVGGPDSGRTHVEVRAEQTSGSYRMR
ncbi:hypothetical protein GCM10009541_00580 [Micromonospora gifhornensis]|uniref:Uncharacterized protein n=1 Tax=Micromonospora gifhornensis TaxID=84594 RepID=A0ABQ4IJI2_9ACTN|nr:hypothetical protein Vgi01_47040 [Micromonospora gifhornensis]